MNIHEVRVAKVACCGGEVMVGEVTFNFLGQELHATAQEYDGTQLTVSKGSVYDFLAGDGTEPVDEFMFEFNSWAEAETEGDSNYAHVAFEVLERVMNAFDMEGRDA